MNWFRAQGEIYRKMINRQRLKDAPEIGGPPEQAHFPVRGVGAL
jgi:hypothetical protein